MSIEVVELPSFLAHCFFQVSHFQAGANDESRRRLFGQHDGQPAGPGPQPPLARPQPLQPTHHSRRSRANPQLRPGGRPWHDPRCAFTHFAVGSLCGGELLRRCLSVSRERHSAAKSSSKVWTKCWIRFHNDIHGLSHAAVHVNTNENHQPWVNQYASPPISFSICFAPNHTVSALLAI